MKIKVDPAIKAVIFDCDGVLIDTEHLKYQAWRDAFKKYNIDFNLQDYLPLIGKGSKDIVKEFCKVKNLNVNNCFSIIQEKNQLYRMKQKNGILPIPSAIKLVKKLFEEKEFLNIKLALASSAPRDEICHNLNEIDLNHVFDQIISGHDDLTDIQDFQGINKPKPYIYIRLAEWLNVKPEHCLVFEDTTSGVKAASNAQMIVFAVPNELTTNQDFSDAYRIISELSENEVYDFIFASSIKWLNKSY